jgi:hypothetical protein
MKASRWVYVSCVLLVLALVRPSVLLAGNSFLDSLQNRLDRAAIDLTIEGFEPTHAYPGLLSGGAATVVNLWLTRGKDYGFVAVCESCSGMDLALYDSRNNLVASDVGTGDQPVVTVIPRRTGQFKLVLRMTKCSQDDSCYYGIGVVKRSGC